MNKHFPLFLQAFRFGIVGVTAATIHFSVVVFLVQTRNLAPLIANIFGFMIAFQMSYWGNRFWTFHNTTESHGGALIKLLILQIMNFLVNETLFYIFLQLHIPYTLALFIILAFLAVCTFITNRKWVFKISAS